MRFYGLTPSQLRELRVWELEALVRAMQKMQEAR